MKRIAALRVVIAVILAAAGCRSSGVVPPSPVVLPPLPAGQLSDFRIARPEEIATPTLLEPRAAAYLLPQNLRFVTLAEFAEKVPPARQYLDAHPEHAHYGMSFLEFVRQDHFSIDGRPLRLTSPNATLVWLASVTSREPSPSKSDDYVFAAFAIPDDRYVRYMRSKGHHAQTGRVELDREGDMYVGVAEVEGLRVEMTCKLLPEETEGQPGQQRVFTPGVGHDSVLVISFAGHRHRHCEGTWRLTGSHPLVGSVPLPFSVVATDFTVHGGMYRLDQVDGLR